MFTKKAVVRACAYLLSISLAIVLVPCFVVQVHAASQADIPQNMWDNPALRSLEYLGYNLDQQKEDGTLYVLYGYDTEQYMPDPYIEYPDDTGCDGTYKDWVGKGKTGGYKYTSKTGLAPIVSYFQKHGFVCAAYFGYYIWNYLPNIEGVDLGAFADYKDYTSYNIQSVKYWWKVLEAASKNADTKVTKLYTAPFDVEEDPGEEVLDTFLPGDLLIFGTSKADGTEVYSHCTIYAGEYGGRHWVIQSSDSCYTGPHIYPFDTASEGGDYKSPSHLVSAYRLGFVPQDTYDNGMIEVYKTDSDGNALYGASFKITHQETGDVFYMGPTDNSGYAMKDDLVFGTYLVEEVVFPEGYTSGGEVQWTVTIGASTPQTIRLHVVNEPLCGSITIQKETNTGTDLSGWNIDLYNKEMEHLGVYTIPASGVFTISALPQGTYYLMEQEGTDCFWICDPETKEVYVSAGTDVSVSFTNRIKTGTISVQKVNTQGETLTGAEFLLEWSVDGTDWKTVYNTDTQLVTEGQCVSAGLSDGKLAGDENGWVCFSGLHPQLYYRLTEVKSPEGYILLTEPVYEGYLPAGDEILLKLTVVNARAYELPMTGSCATVILRIIRSILIVASIGMLLLPLSKRYDE